MRSFKMTLAYDGSHYAGWQYQPNCVTVQGTLESALTQITGQAVRVTASGRTDAGVHALGQVAGFRAETRLACETLRRALNANTPRDLYVRQLEVAPERFDPIRDATGKRYRYVIQDGRDYDVFQRAYAWHVPHRLNDDALRAAAARLLGRHDFRSFETAGAPRHSTVRTIRELTTCRIPVELGQRLVIEVEADGFLYNMVRNIVGSLCLIGKGDQPPQWIDHLLAALDRRQAGPTAPPHGLFLLRVEYEPLCDPCASPM